MLTITATTLLDALLTAATREGLYCGQTSKWEGLAFETPSLAVDAILDDLLARASLLDSPRDVERVTVSFINGEGSNWGCDEFNTADIKHWGDGVIWSWGQLHQAIQDATWAMAGSHVLPYLLRVGIDYSFEDSIELDVLADWSDESAAWMLGDAVLVSSRNLA